jgi:hypothetical protein
MSINDLPSALLSEHELTQQVAELEERLRCLGEPSSSFEWRRRAFFETLAKIRRQQLAALRQSTGAKVNRREFPRIAIDVPGQIEGPDGGTGEVRVANLARRGAGILLTREAAVSVFPDVQGATGQTLSLQFQLRLAASEHVSLRAECKVAWIRQLGYDDYRMGVQFLSFDREGEHHLDRYILDCLDYDG